MERPENLSSAFFFIKTRTPSGSRPTALSRGVPAPHAGFISLTSRKETNQRNGSPAVGFFVWLMLLRLNGGGWEIDLSRLRCVVVVFAVYLRSRLQADMTAAQGQLGINRDTSRTSRKCPHLYRAMFNRNETNRTKEPPARDVEVKDIGYLCL